MDPIEQNGEPRETQEDRDLLDRLRAVVRDLPSGEPLAELRRTHRRVIQTALSSAGPARRPEEDRPAFPGFEILEEIAPGVGGMGMVFKARELSLDRIVALKTVKHRLRSARGRAFFVKEARAAAKLDHPHIIRIFSFNPTARLPYYVMQFVDGRPIDEACRGKDADSVALLLEKTARALGVAHAQGILHRDIKPDNVLVDQNNEPRIADFGLASHWSEDETNDMPEGQALLGTPALMAPECLQPGAALSPTVDIYSLGVMMYKLLTGRYPYRGKSISELREDALRSLPPMPQEIDPDIPEPLQRICLKAMERDPARRYASAEQMADDLRRFRERREVFARPSRYQLELVGQLRNHLTDIRLWRQQCLIRVPEMDRLMRPYQKMLEEVSHWRELSRQFPWEAVLLRLGGWLVLISSLLWPLFYWEDLTRGQRIAGVGVPTLVLNLAGLLFLVRGNLLNAKIFLSTGALLLPVLTGVVLVEYEWARLPQTIAWELSGAPENPEVPTNAQITVAVGVFFACCLLLFRRLRAFIFAAWICVGAYALFGGFWLRMGVKELIELETMAEPLLSFIILPLLLFLVARAMARTESAPCAGTFYSFFPGPLAVLLTLLAVRGAVEWFDAEQVLDNQLINLWCIANGILYGVVGMLSAGSHVGFIRLWSHFFMLLLPFSVLVPMNLLFLKGPELFVMGGHAVGPYEAASVAVAALFIAGGIRMGRETLAIPGLLGLATYLFRITDLHFRDARGWALALLVLGSLSILVGLILSTIRRRRAIDLGAASLTE